MDEMTEVRNDRMMMLRSSGATIHHHVQCIAAYTDGTGALLRDRYISYRTSQKGWVTCG